MVPQKSGQLFTSRKFGEVRISPISRVIRPSIGVIRPSIYNWYRKNWQRGSGSRDGVFKHIRYEMKRVQQMLEDMTSSVENPKINEEKSDGSARIL